MSLGDSAGGNLAAAVSLRLRDEEMAPPIKLQVLLYPVVQSINFNLPSYKRYQHDTLLPRDIMVAMWLFYAQGNALIIGLSIERPYLMMRLKLTS